MEEPSADVRSPDSSSAIVSLAGAAEPVFVVATAGPASDAATGSVAIVALVVFSIFSLFRGAAQRMETLKNCGKEAKHNYTIIMRRTFDVLKP